MPERENPDPGRLQSPSDGLGVRELAVEGGQVSHEVRAAPPSDNGGQCAQSRNGGWSPYGARWSQPATISGKCGVPEKFLHLAQLLRRYVGITPSCWRKLS